MRYHNHPVNIVDNRVAKLQLSEPKIAGYVRVAEPCAPHEPPSRPDLHSEYDVDRDTWLEVEMGTLGVHILFSRTGQ